MCLVTTDDKFHAIDDVAKEIKANSIVVGKRFERHRSTTISGLFRLMNRAGPRGHSRSQIPLGSLSAYLIKFVVISRFIHQSSIKQNHL